MLEDVTDDGLVNELVAELSVQYVNVPGSLPAVTNPDVKSTVNGSHIGAGSETAKLGAVQQFRPVETVLTQEEEPLLTLAKNSISSTQPITVT